MKRVSHIAIAVLMCVSTAAYADDIKVNLADCVATNGNISVSASVLENTRNGAYAIYQVTVPETGIYDAYALFGTKKDGSSLSVDMDVDLEVLKSRLVEKALTEATTNPNNWTAKDRYTFGPFLLKQGHTYFLRINFLQEVSGSWVGNVHELGLSKTAEQDESMAIHVDVVQDEGYTLFANNFDGHASMYPFWRGWAWDPCYIEQMDGCAEFYFNQAALDADDRRMRRGAELTCNYKTTRDGWYSFRIYLPEGKFPKDVDGSIIAQIFNNGDRNSWAGVLTIDQDKINISYRKALIEPTVKTVGTAVWDQWIPLVVYFKAGRNGKGRIKVWMGNDMTEAAPIVDSGNIDFGFGEWIDDETLNGEVTAENEVADYLGCKFGLYVSKDGDRTIRYDDIKALEGNPAGAFDIVKPTPHLVTLDENAIIVPVSQYANVTLKRAIAANTWSTICLPFSMNAQQVTATFGEGVALATLTGGDASTLNFETVASIEANKPYAIKVRSAFEEALIEGVNIVNGSTTQTVGNWNFVGNYTKDMYIPADAYFFSHNRIVKSGAVSSNIIQPFRGYFTYNGGSNASEMTFSIDGETTGINSLTPSPSPKGKGSEVYDLQGRRIENPKKGIYIINQKKIVVK